MNSDSDLFLGFDLSTQQLKVIVTNEKLAALKTYAVEFDKAFKIKYGIKKGVLNNDETGEILSPVHMWLDALDHVFDEMKSDNFPFDKVRGLSGSGMQHGSVFWSQSASEALNSMKGKLNLSEALTDAFATEMSPNWQDHSTGQEIKDFEAVAGGPEELATRTGSRAHYRFTGLQIRKLAARTAPEVYANTARISLVSSFLASVLLGEIVPLEASDACGMNLFNMHDKNFDEELLAVAAGVHPKLDGVSQTESDKGVADLKQKLGEVTPVTYQPAGQISPYFQEKYGFQPDAQIYPFTGDNLATIISMPLEENDLLISLGTSTTVLLVTKNFKPSSQYHLFAHPTMKDAYMGMICYCNGSLAREKVRDAVNDKYGLEHDSWDKFNEILDECSKFDDRLGIYFPLGEIVPNAAAQYERAKFENGKDLKYVESWDVENDVSSIVESQTISCRLRAGPMLTSSRGPDMKTTENKKLQKLYDDVVSHFGEISTDGKKQDFASLISRPHRVFFVGGASRNTSIVSKMGSIMGATDASYQVEIPNACALGGAFKASWSFQCQREQCFVDFNEYLNRNFDYGELDKLDVEDQWEDYFPSLGMLAKMEENLKTE